MSEEKRILREMAKMIKKMENHGVSLEICGDCGNIVSEGEPYCSQCGVRIEGKPSIKVKRILLMD